MTERYWKRQPKETGKDGQKRWLEETTERYWKRQPKKTRRDWKRRPKDIGRDN